MRFGSCHFGLGQQGTVCFARFWDWRSTKRRAPLGITANRDQPHEPKVVDAFDAHEMKPASSNP
jgi:hypothetical protein